MKILMSLLALAATAQFALAEEPAAPEKPKVDPEVAFKAKDKDSDGSISKEEWTSSAKNPEKAEKGFAKKDKDSDGKITLEEFTTGKK